jgi:hypothetical protein
VIEVGFEVLTAVSMRMAVFYVLEVYQNSEYVRLLEGGGRSLFENHILPFAYRD